MYTQIKILDKQLKKLKLLRLPDSTSKSQGSLFRALSSAIYFSINFYQQVKQELRLTLISNLTQKKTTVYPALASSFLLKKYQAQPQWILNYWEKPQKQCFFQVKDMFTQDNLLLCSTAFARTVILLNLDKQQYINQIFYCESKNASKQAIYIAKIGKKYFGVVKQSIYQKYQRIRQITQYVIKVLNQIVNSIFQKQQKKQQIDQACNINYRQQLQTPKKSRTHKKSLSQCDNNSPTVFQQGKLQRKTLGNQNNIQHNSFDRQDQQLFGAQSPIHPVNIESTNIDTINIQQHNFNYYAYQYPYNITEQMYSYMEYQTPVNNQRYRGRLKFFQQNGNYGFIVIDGMNIDLFVHYDDLSKAGISRQMLFNIKNNYQLRFQFTYYQYEGRQNKKSKKAVDLTLIPMQ